MNKKSKLDQSKDITAALLNWYDIYQRQLPWRFSNDQDNDPYKTWLSEIMLQQTQVATVIPYFRKFISVWPSLQDMAKASLDDVLVEWAGLGYYARARNMHKCAQILTSQYNGEFPREEAELLKLPGIGEYTAAAIAAIAFGQKATPFDGNFERVIARLRGITISMPKAKPLLKRLAVDLTPEVRAGDYAQAVMDLGATVCTARNPKCKLCPVHYFCWSFANGKTESIPSKKLRQTKPIRHGTAFMVLNTRGELLLRRRPSSGLLGGMMEIPSTPWNNALNKSVRAAKLEIKSVKWTNVPGLVKHIFTHFKLELKVMIARVDDSTQVPGCQWYSLRKIDSAGLPTIMLKVINHAAKNATDDYFT